MTPVAQITARRTFRPLRLTEPQARALLGATRSVALAAGPAEGGARLLEVLATELALPDCDSSGGVPSLSDVFAGEDLCRAIGFLIVPACIDGHVSEAGQRAALELARAAGVRSPWVDLLEALRRGNVLAIKRALMTRAPDLRRMLGRTWEEEGVRGIGRAFLFAAGAFRDPALAERYRALAGYPTGTFGRAVADHFAARDLAYPGEKGGMPERMLHHDLMHVLNGYDTDPAGECELAGFYAGCADGDGLTFLAVALATFHLGLPVSPAAVTPARGAFDPARVAAAFERGLRLRVDVMGPWDYWSLFPLPVVQVRERLGIEDQPGRPFRAVG